MEAASVLHNPRKLRVLALHSFRTSAAIFKQQLLLSQLDKNLEDLIEVVFIDAPYPPSGPIPKDVSPPFKPPFYEWFTVDRRADGGLDIDLAKLAGSKAAVAAALAQRGPFDGLMGFSQGAALAAALVADQQAGRALSDVPRLSFCLLFAGVKPPLPPSGNGAGEAGPSSAPGGGGVSTIQCPSCHVIGERDFVKKYALELAHSFDKPVILMHPRGHVIPGLEPQQLGALRGFLAGVQQQLAQRPAAAAAAAAAGPPADVTTAASSRL